MTEKESRNRNSNAVFGTIFKIIISKEMRRNFVSLGSHKMVSHNKRMYGRFLSMFIGLQKIFIS
jgi:hypothetical protein